MHCLNSDEQYSYPYPQVQPPNCVVQSMFCDACSQLAKTSSGADISKKSGTKVFKIETLKKHEKSQAHVSCTETLKVRQKPQESPLAKSLNKASTSADAKLGKKILTAFTVVALERPFDDYETVCALQSINGADLGETYVTRSACTEFLSNKSEVMKDEIAEK